MPPAAVDSRCSGRCRSSLHPLASDSTTGERLCATGRASAPRCQAMDRVRTAFFRQCHSPTGTRVRHVPHGPSPWHTRSSANASTVQGVRSTSDRPFRPCHPPTGTRVRHVPHGPGPWHTRSSANASTVQGDKIEFRQALPPVPPAADGNPRRPHPHGPSPWHTRSSANASTVQGAERLNGTGQ